MKVFNFFVVSTIILNRINRKKITYFLSVLILTGCATSHKINNVSYGMSKNEVIQKTGRPNSTSSNGNAGYLNYKLTENPDAAFYG